MTPMVVLDAFSCAGIPSRIVCRSSSVAASLAPVVGGDHQLGAGALLVHPYDSGVGDAVEPRRAGR
uniref:Uncharacterized protein n=1 Tax=Janibacter limosus TaxID=53458 RepID=A0AC61U3Q7_9MICO|nr:hypothetical protein [Janibacter limosus]